MTMTNTPRKLIMHGCPRCHGDLLHDDYESEYDCLQCGRRIEVVNGEPVANRPAAIEELKPKPLVVRTRAEARRLRKAA